jgi:hypothetical protein
MPLRRDELAHDVPIAFAALAPVGLALGLAAHDGLTLAVSVLAGLACGSTLLLRVRPEAARVGILATVAYALGSPLALTGAATGVHAVVACGLVLAEAGVIALTLANPFLALRAALA